MDMYYTKLFLFPPSGENCPFLARLEAEAFPEDGLEAGDALVHLIEAFLEVFPDVAELTVVAVDDVGFDLFGCVDVRHTIVGR